MNTGDALTRTTSRQRHSGWKIPEVLMMVLIFKDEQAVVRGPG
jgi:hypothetical protein